MEAIRIRKYDSRDEATVVRIFDRLLNSQADYPPQKVIAKLGGLRKWIGMPPLNERWVAGAEGTVVGYVEIGDVARLEEGTSRHAYWAEALSGQKQLNTNNVIAIKRLGVDPHYQQQGCGKALMKHSLQRGKEIYKKTPVLVVIQNLEAARRLYHSLGGLKIGEMTGNSGKTLDVYAF